MAAMSDATIVSRPPRLGLREAMMIASSKPAFPRVSTVCAGAASTPASWLRSVSPGFWTTGGHAGRHAVGCAEGESDAAFHQFRRRTFQQRLSRRRGARPRSGSAGSPTGSAQELFFITLALYLTATAATAAVLGCRELRVVSVSPPAPALAANTRRSIRRSRNWCPRVTADD